MAWQKTISKSELEPGSKRLVKVYNREILLIHHCDKIYATARSCPHWGLPLDGGRLTDDCGLICPHHRSGFDLATGDVKAWAPWPPGLSTVIGATSRRKVLPTFPTYILNGDIWVTLDPADAANPPTAEVAAPPAPAAESDKSAPSAETIAADAEKPAPPTAESASKTAPSTTEAGNPTTAEKPAS